MAVSSTVRDSLSSSRGLSRVMVRLCKVELSSRMDTPTDRSVSGCPSTNSRVYVGTRNNRCKQLM